MARPPAKLRRSLPPGDRPWNAATPARTVEDAVDMAAIYERLAARRVELGLSQKQVARLIDVSQSMISNWETGWHAPSFAKLVRWATALGMQLTVVPTV